MTAIDYLRLGVEQYLRELTDDEFAQLLAIVRPPQSQPPSPEVRATLSSVNT